MKKLLISVFAGLASTVGLANAAVIEFGAGSAAHRIGGAQEHSLISADGDVRHSSREARSARDELLANYSSGFGACMLSNGSLTGCENLIGVNAGISSEFKSVNFVFGHHFDLFRFSFSGAQRLAGDSSQVTYLFNKAKWSFTDLFAAMLSGVSSVTFVWNGAESTEFDQTIPLPASALLILSGLGAFGVAARGRRRHTF